jgi:hypothetical protein
MRQRARAVHANIAPQFSILREHDGSSEQAGHIRRRAAPITASLVLQGGRARRVRTGVYEDGGAGLRARIGSPISAINAALIASFERRVRAYVNSGSSSRRVAAGSSALFDPMRPPSIASAPPRR